MEIEFAANLLHEPALFNVLQIRPISADGLTAQVDWEHIDQTEPIVLSDSALGVGRVDGVRDIIYLRQEAFDILHTQEMAETLRQWNTRMRLEGKGYVLMAFGRIGSQIPTLGLPVQWSDISEAKVLVECSLPSFQIDPSQGSHFFQNMTSFNVGYVNVNPFARPADMLDDVALDRLAAVEETEYVRHVRLEEPLEIYIDGFRNHAMIKCGVGTHI